MTTTRSRSSSVSCPPERPVLRPEVDAPVVEEVGERLGRRRLTGRIQGKRLLCTTVVQD